MAPGEYTVRISAVGFSAKTSESPITLQVGQSKTVDATLEVGSVTETVDLIGEIPLIDTTRQPLMG